jgi:hypothetical protein
MDHSLPNFFFYLLSPDLPLPYQQVDPGLVLLTGVQRALGHEGHWVTKGTGARRALGIGSLGQPGAGHSVAPPNKTNQNSVY